MDIKEEHDEFFHELDGRGFIFQNKKWLGGCFEDDQLQVVWEMWQAKAQAVPEGFVLVPKAESTGLTDKNDKLIFVGDVVEFVGGCRDFLDLSGVKSPLYTVNKGDKMIVRKLKSGYTLSLPWIDCDAPNRIGNLGNYDFWNLCRDFIVIEAQVQSHDGF